MKSRRLRNVSQTAYGQPRAALDQSMNAQNGPAWACRLMIVDQAPRKLCSGASSQLMTYKLTEFR